MTEDTNSKTLSSRSNIAELPDGFEQGVWEKVAHKRQSIRNRRVNIITCAVVSLTLVTGVMSTPDRAVKSSMITNAGLELAPSTLLVGETT
jgi:hypothetical protein